jgi:hypothetical protein
MDKVHEFTGEVGAEVTPCATLEFGNSLPLTPTFFVNPILGHGIKGVHDRHHSSLKRDFLSSKTGRVPLPVEALMMMTNSKSFVRQFRMSFEHSITVFCMRIHEFSLERIECTGFVQNRIGYPDFSEIVESCRERKTIDIDRTPSSAKHHPLRPLAHEGSDPQRMSVSGKIFICDPEEEFFLEKKRNRIHAKATFPFILNGRSSRKNNSRTATEERNGCSGIDEEKKPEKTVPR